MDIESLRDFRRQACWHLLQDYLPKIKRCLEELSEEQVWWRPNAHCNSIGNLLLHLEGNVRQWIVSGVGRRPDVRDRDGEFAEGGPLPASQLFARLKATVEEAAEVIAALDQGALDQPRKIQIYDVTCRQAIFHVVEHFSQHTGQIIYITKMLLDVDLKFYDL